MLASALRVPRMLSAETLPCEVEAAAARWSSKSKAFPLAFFWGGAKRGASAGADVPMTL